MLGLPGAAAYRPGAWRLPKAWRIRAMLSPALKTGLWLTLVVLAWIPAGGIAAERFPSDDQFSANVRVAFQDAISLPAKSTVQVYCDGYRSALGAVVKPDGYIATKASELKGKIEVQLHDVSRKYAATVVATDKPTDLAILKIDAKSLPVIPWSDNTAPAVGTWLATPGLINTPIAIGVLSVAARKITAPSGALGIQLDSADDVARIAMVMEDTPAEKAGLKDGDVIRKINGKEIKGRQHAQETIRSYQPGDKVELVVERGGGEQTFQAVLGNLNILLAGERAEFQNSLGGPLSERRSGFPLAIQHDSVLRPTECGGPIVDLDGKAVGLNIARAGRVESYALPASVVRETVERLLQAPLAGSTADDMLVGKTNKAEGEKKVQ
jgi:serine protease Do